MWMVAVVLIGLINPRLLMLFIAILTDWFGRAWESMAWPIVGFCFMPYTTCAYMASVLRNTGSAGNDLAVLVAAAVLIDLAFGLNELDKRVKDKSE